MVKDIITSAINLKKTVRDTHCKKLNILPDCKVTVLLEVNEPTLLLAVSKASTLLGAQDNIVIDQILWDQDYVGKIFSYMSDAIFVSTSTHGCLKRFAEQSRVPVMCMKSRAHSTIQALATVMAIQEEFGSLKGLNVSYIGTSDPVLNSYLLLCPMLEANIKFKCCCDTQPISPLLYKASADLCSKQNTDMKSCRTNKEALADSSVVIAGPTDSMEKKQEFRLKLQDITSSTKRWIFFHSCPKGKEVDDELFFHKNSRTFSSFENMQYIAAALLANSIKGKLF